MMDTLDLIFRDAYLSIMRCTESNGFPNRQQTAPLPDAPASLARGGYASAWRTLSILQIPCLARAREGYGQPPVGWGGELSEPRRKNSAAKTNLQEESQKVMQKHAHS